ncbi:MAG: VIT1/CCC1 transporter family protein [Thaumarchaeota archaeon]|nr:VIT1/CCC1 transporter family protein [Nitrososphaerota archaeon]
MKEARRRTAGTYIGDMVFGAQDGLVTTFAVVAGSNGAALSSAIILILGLANLIADGVSMATGDYLGTKSELEYARREREYEEWKVDHHPERETEDIRRIYASKGFKGADLEKAVHVITSDKKVWLDTMMLEDLNVVGEGKSPVKTGLAIFAAFVTAGFAPLAVYVADLFFPVGVDKFAASTVSTAITLFTVGAVRTFVTGKRWWTSAVEMTLVGGFAASTAYLVGYLLRGLTG